MKKFILFARYHIWLVFALPASAPAQNPASFPNYVVIGAFTHQHNAVRFTEDAKQNSFAARLEMNRNRNLYYVYVTTTYDSALAFSEALKLRKETKYFDAWVYHGGFGDSQLSDAAGSDVQDIDPVTGRRLESVAGDQRPARDEKPQASLTRRDATKRAPTPPSAQVSSQATTAPAGENQTTKENNARVSNVSDAGRSSAKIAQSPESDSVEDPSSGLDAEANRDASDNESDQPSQMDHQTGITALTSPGLAATGSVEKSRVTDEKIPGTAGSPQDEQPEVNTNQVTLTGTTPVKLYSKQEAAAPLTSEEVVGKDFLFQLYRADNLVIVEGEVEAIDVERSRRMATYQANTPVKVLMPSGNSKHVSFVSQVFGYRKMQREFDPASPSQDLYLDKDGNLVVPFELVRLQKGDIAIMYNVFFFKDAAVMRPESRYEVNNLLELLNENPDYKIRIHGHTNGNASGKIIRMGQPGNFYSLSGTTQGFGSAKKLSEERAIVIKQYLVSSGVSDDRMQIKAWGGKKPIHDKHAVRANENVRVEIEILSE